MLRLRRLLLIVGLTTSPAAALLWPNQLADVETDLGSPQEPVRLAATQRLLELPPRMAERLVKKAIQDPSVRVKMSAAEAAIELGLSDVGRLVLPWLGDKERDLRLLAVRVLEISPTAEALPLLARVLSDPDPTVRQQAARALQESRGAEAVLALVGHLDDGEPKVRLAVVNALGRLGDPQAVVPLIGKSQDTNSEMRARVATALGQLGDRRAQPALLLLLGDSEPFVRREAVGALGIMGDADSVLAAKALLRADGDALVRREAAMALSRIGSPAAISALVDLLSEESSGAAHDAAMTALETLRAKAGDALRTCLNHRTDPGQLASCAALAGQAQLEDATQLISNALQKGRISRSVALRALGASGDPLGLSMALEQLVAANPEVRREAISATSALLGSGKADGRAVEPLLFALNEAKRPESERIQLIELLGQTGSSRAAKPLMEIAQRSTNLEVFEACLVALGKLGSAGQTKFLILSLDADLDSTRLAAATALEQVATADAANDLLTHLARAPRSKRPAVIRALGGALRRQSDNKVLAKVLTAIQISQGAERDALIEALGRSRTSEGASALSQVKGRGASVADRAKLAEVASDAPLLRPLTLQLLKDPSPSVRANAAWAMGSVGIPSDRAQLETLLEDGSVAVVANALVAFGNIAKRHPSPKPTLPCTLLGHPHSYVRANLLFALARGAGSCDTQAIADTLRKDASSLVRSRAAHLLHGPAHSQSQLAARALSDCAATDPSGTVALSCQEARDDISEGHTLLTVLVVPEGGVNPAPNAAYAVELADGSLRLGTTDRRGAVSFASAPSGRVSLLTPAQLIR